MGQDNSTISQKDTYRHSSKTAKLTAKMLFSSKTMETTTEEDSKNSSKQEWASWEPQVQNGKVASQQEDYQVPLSFPRNWIARLPRWKKVYRILSEWTHAWKRHDRISQRRLVPGILQARSTQRYWAIDNKKVLILWSFSGRLQMRKGDFVFVERG